MRKKAYFFIFSLYILTAIYFLKKDIVLEYEWMLIMDDFSKYGYDYRLFGMPTAYMPPFYPYFLLFCSKTLGNYWLQIVCIIQGTIVFLSSYWMFKGIFGEKINSTTIILAYCSVIFFPPLLVGTYKISSFAFSLSVMLIFFTILHKIYEHRLANKKQLVYLLMVSVIGMYLRYEFIFIIILSALVFYFRGKISFKKFISSLVILFIIYLPWCIRNYIEIGTFTYSTSFNFNFAKGYNEKYDTNIIFNNPYSPELKKILTNKTLSEMFTNEKDMNDYLRRLNQDFISENPELFIELTGKKLLINLTQYFPGYEGINRFKLYFAYSFYMITFQTFLIFAIRKKFRKNKKDFLLYGTAIFYMFFVLFYVVAPLPRYLLLFYPIFTAVILHSFYDDIQKRLLRKTKLKNHIL
ncbi:hypothetical protein [Epilithonimonas caeni]|uniref:hypothetical protein n=1 Tax=Epilithonimonas caeni TaxID=365343 RepID=UPI0004840EB3|nr:hypothetical protein [Epilithonimonas caeni]